MLLQYTDIFFTVYIASNRGQGGCTVVGNATPEHASYLPTLPRCIKVVLVLLGIGSPHFDTPVPLPNINSAFIGVNELLPVSFDCPVQPGFGPFSTFQ